MLLLFFFSVKVQDIGTCVHVHVCRHRRVYVMKSHWISHGDYTIEFDNIGVGELAHDGCLLEKFEFLSHRSTWLQRLDGKFHGGPSNRPKAFANLSKLARPKLLQNSTKLARVEHTPHDVFVFVLTYVIWLLGISLYLFEAS